MRPRQPGNKTLPINLHRKLDKRTGKTYYTYRNPSTGTVHGLGTDAEAAHRDACALNSAIYASIRSAALSSIITPATESVKIEKVIASHLEYCKSLGLAKNTMRLKLSYCNKLKAALTPDKSIMDVTVTDLAELLDEYDDRPRTRQSLRTEAVEVWKTALHNGWATVNVANMTRTNKAAVKRSRLTLEDFHKIHSAALTLPNKWIARSMELALLTAQRVSDIRAMEFKKLNSSTAWLAGDELCVMQIKSQLKTKILIPLDIGLNDWTIRSVMKSCQSNIITRWIIHHSTHHGGAKPGMNVSLGSISRSFAEARDLAGVAGGSENPPTFHEIRSLSIRLYKEKFGPAFAQAIAGHKNAKTSSLYADVRGAEWVQVKAG